MLTYGQIADMAPNARTQLFDQLTGDLFPTQAAACAALDIALRTSQVWRSQNTVPAMALLALQSIAAAPNQPSAIVQDARQIAGHLEKVGRELAQLTEIMASVAKRLPDPS